MLSGAKNGTVKIGSTDMEYISFGHGHENLIMLPGLGDGIRTVKGAAAAMAVMYRRYGKNYKVYVFSRKNKLEENYSIRDMAKDQREAMGKLGITKAHILGISQGGMIAQCLAADYPDTVDKLILAVTLSRLNETAEQVISSWTEMAERNDYRALFIDTFEKSYTEKYKKKYRRLYPILAGIGRPKSFGRFIIQANAILFYNAYEDLNRITSRTLVIGAGKDEIAGAAASREIADKIAGSSLIIYNDFGHGVYYEESKDFIRKVLGFLKQ